MQTRLSAKTHILRAFIFIFAGAILAQPINADTFFSGRTDIDDSLGGLVTDGVKRLDGFSGHTYLNQVHSAANPTGFGETVNVIGFVHSPTAQAGLSSGPGWQPESRISAVFAAQAIFKGNLATGDLFIDYEGQSTVVNFYDFGAGHVYDPADPTTWLPNINDVTQGLVATMTLSPRPDDAVQGPPGGVLTDQLLGANAALINTGRAPQGELGLPGDTDLKLFYDPNNPVNTLFSFQDGYLVNPEHPAFLVDIDGLLESVIASTLDLTDIDNLETLFAGLLGEDFIPAGDTFTPTDPTTGDVSEIIEGGFAVPGSQQVAPPRIPEPSSVLVWGLVGLAAAGFGYRRRRQANG